MPAADEDGDRRPDETPPAPKRRADVPTDAPAAQRVDPRPDAAPRCRVRTRASTPPNGKSGATAGTSGLGQAVERSRRPGPCRASSAASPVSRAEAAKDRFEDLKENVHTELLQQLGPQLYDANLEADELASQGSRRPRRRARRHQPPADPGRPGAHHPGHRRRHPRLRTARALPARRRRRRGHGQRPLRHLARAQGQADQGRWQVQGRGTPAPHDRQDRLAHRPPRRRVLPHGRRPPP